MDKYINLVLDLPATLNQKLPKNNFNQVMDDSILPPKTQLRLLKTQALEEAFISAITSSGNIKKIKMGRFIDLNFSFYPSFYFFF